MSVTLQVDWQLKPIPFFTLEEVNCNCGCGLAILNVDLLKTLLKVRIEFGEPIIVESWTRCPYWNKKVGGKRYSYHRWGKAVDISPADPNKIYILKRICLKYFPFVLDSGTVLHCDIRGWRSLRTK